MSLAHDVTFGPYTAEDLHSLPDEGKGFELVDGWLIELSPSTPHIMVVRALSKILDSAASAAAADVLVTTESDISTPAGIRRPDVAVLDGKAARTTARLERSAFFGADVQLAVEVVSRGSASEREDRIRKVAEYAAAGIPEYWIVDFAPEVRIQIHRLGTGAYDAASTIDQGQTLTIESPVRASFDPAELVAWRSDQ